MKLDALKKVTGTMVSTEEKETEYSETKDKITRRLTVREVENGFIIEVRESGYKGKNETDWYCANQTYISSTNPLEESEKGKTEKSDIDDLPTVKEKIAGVLKNLTL